MANRSAELEAYPNHHNQQLAIMQVYFENIFFKFNLRHCVSNRSGQH